MRERQALLIDLAAYRELTTERERELLAQVPEAEQLRAAYERQDELLAALPRPQVPARAVARVFAATAAATDKVRRPALVSQRWAVPALVVVLFLAMLGGTGYAAAQSLPGDGLYGVKRAAEHVRLAMMTREEARLAYERQLEERRRAEIQALLAQGRQGVQVAFTGLLQQGPGGAWTVADLPVALPLDVQPRPGLEVRVEGWTADGRVQASVVTPLVTPEPTPNPGPVGSPWSSPTGSPATRTPQAAPTDSATGAGEPQHRQGGTAPARPTTAKSTPTSAATAKATIRAETTTAGPDMTAAPTSATTPNRAGQTATVTARRTSAPTAAPRAPVATPGKRGKPPTSPGGNGAGQSEPSGGSSGSGTGGSKGGKP